MEVIETIMGSSDPVVVTVMFILAFLIVFGIVKKLFKLVVVVCMCAVAWHFFGNDIINLLYSVGGFIG